MSTKTCRFIKEFNKQGTFRPIVIVTFKDKNSL